MNELMNKPYWFYIEGDLDIVFGFDNFDFRDFGFSIADVRLANQNQYQLDNEDGVMVTLYPISNMEQFTFRLGSLIESQSQKYRVITSEEAQEIHERLLALFNERIEAESAIPTEDEILTAQQLLLLTEIRNSLINQKDS